MCYLLLFIFDIWKHFQIFQYGKPMTKEVYHNCHICGKDLLQQSKNIKKHVKSHNISLEKYFEVYVQGGRVSRVN